MDNRVLPFSGSFVLHTGRWRYWVCVTGRFLVLYKQRHKLATMTTNKQPEQFPQHLATLLFISINMYVFVCARLSMGSRWLQSERGALWICASVQSDSFSFCSSLNLNELYWSADYRSKIGHGSHQFGSKQDSPVSFSGCCCQDWWVNSNVA